jgi:hypothetical protein
MNTKQLPRGKVCDQVLVSDELYAGCAEQPLQLQHRARHTAKVVLVSDSLGYIPHHQTRSPAVTKTCPALSRVILQDLRFL